LQDRAVLSLDLVSLPLGDAVSRQDKNLVSRLLSGLATNDDFVCATIMGLDEKVVDHAATKVEQRIPTAADLKQLTTGLGETMPPARRLDLTFDRAIAFVQPLYADDGRTIATLFARFSTERAIAEYMRGIVEGALAGLLVLVTIAFLLYELVARVTAPLTQLTEAIHSLGAGNLSVART
jgi:nitrate/nitrite-specific signal transduction histidine kinase